MPTPKFKSENYINLGGINSKVSPYQTGPHEFLDLVNYDFQTPASLSTRWGSTQYLATSASFVGQINSLFEFSKLDGTSMIIFSHSGSIWYGATSGAQFGISMASLSATLAYGIHMRFVTWVGGVGIVETNGSAVPFIGGSLFQDDSATFVVNPINRSSFFFDYNVANNILYMADGSNYFSFNGATTYSMSLPYATNGINGFCLSPVNTQPIPYGFVYNFYGAYLNNVGVEGPAFPISRVNLTATAASLQAGGGGATAAYITYNLNTPLAYGLSAINIYVARGGVSSGIQGDIYDLDMGFIRKVSFSGSTLTTVDVGPGASFNYSTVDKLSINDESSNIFGFTFYAEGSTSSASFGLFQINPSGAFYPRYLENFQNRVFLGGFSNAPSVVQFSEPGEPGNVLIDSFIEVRTNDGDRVTGMKSYLNRLMLFKRNSFHELSGDNPDNFFLREVSDQYGCISNRATAVFNNTMFFLDSKGVMMYNGANITPVSTKIQSIFENMNVTSAEDNATMVHDKLRNQILLGIPVSGSIVNNLTVVYDYVSDAWTKYQGYNPSIFAVIQGRNSSRGIFYGGYSGQIFNFGSSLVGDNGIGFTCMYKTRFLSDMGQTTEKQFRRLFLNMDAVTAATVPISIDFMKNYGTSIVLSKTMYANQFQSRLDYGIPGKSLSYTATYFAATLSIKIHGFGIDYRQQRRV